MDFAELSNEQRRQLIDVQQVFSIWRPSHQELEQIGTMRVQSSKGKRYMYQVHGAVRKSMGRETPALIEQKSRHDAKREALRKSTKSLQKRLDDMAPVNRALGLGRIPAIAARILRELDREGLPGPISLLLARMPFLLMKPLPVQYLGQIMWQRGTRIYFGT
jgi:hypothetical protein